MMRTTQIWKAAFWDRRKGTKLTTCNSPAPASSYLVATTRCSQLKKEGATELAT